MTHRFYRFRAIHWRACQFQWFPISVGLMFVCLIGCSRSPDVVNDADSANVESDTGTETSELVSADPFPSTGPRQPSESASPAATPLQANQPATSDSRGHLPEQLPSPDALIAHLQLRPDSSPRQLNAFLGDADREMGDLINGRTMAGNTQGVRKEVERIIALKRVAAERLSNHADATEKEKIAGQRGVLQALSHLAAMGDMKAAVELQTLAEKMLNSPSAEIRSDSQLVLIGLAIESLRHGKPDAASRVLQLIHELLAADEQVDVATLMVLGQAKDSLLLYDYQDDAAEVRDLILERFGHAQDAEVARMAAKIAGSGFSQENSALEQLDQLRQQFVTTSPSSAANSASESAGKPVTATVWRSAIDAVLATPPDVLTVEFLCGASLEAEAVGRDDIAEATYEVLQQKFADRQDAMGRVARTALRARENRTIVIGKEFQPDLPSVDGRALNMKDYLGKIVLMPFWSTAFPDSLAVLPNLEEIQAAHPERVAIVGMNLDVGGTDVEGFMQAEQLDFPSFRSESDPRAEIVNDVAYRFGAVTLLFVAIMDADGRVVHLDFSGKDLTSEVQKLIR